MKWLGLIIVIFQLVLQAASGETRFALVRFDEITNELAGFRLANEAMEAELKKVSADSRNVQLQETLKELDGVLGQLHEAATSPDRTMKIELAVKAEGLRQEAEGLRQDFAAFEAKEVKRIKRQMLDTILGLQERIKQVAVKVAKDRGFDCLFEIRGNSNTSLPVLIYVKTPSDITGDVLAILKAEEPPASEKPPQPPTPENPPAPAAPPAPAVP